MADREHSDLQKSDKTDKKYPDMHKTDTEYLSMQESGIKRRNEEVRLAGKGKKYKRCMIFLAVLTLIVNILARIPAVCDAYTDSVFWLWTETYGRITGLFPFSVGEILLVLAVLIVCIWLLSFVLLLFLHKRAAYRRYMRLYSLSLLALGLVVLLIMTLNCSMLYGCSHLNVGGHADTEYSASDIQKLWNYIASQCNRLAGEVERDKQGNPVYQGDKDEAVRTAMRKLSESYPRFRGTYPQPKPIHFSYTMYQASCSGVYFPFSMEANYNTYISDLSYPATVAHEWSHLKGYIYEDEADFMSYLACTGSEDAFLQYSGYLAVLGYLQEDYWETNPDSSKEVTLLDQVYQDSAQYAYTEETYEEIESEEPVFEQETVETFSDNITDTYMDYYDATPNYAEVTKLMLAYYDGILY